MPDTLVAPAAPTALAALPSAPSQPAAAPIRTATPTPSKAPSPPPANVPELTDEGKGYDAAFEAREPKKSDAPKPGAAPQGEPKDAPKPGEKGYTLTSNKEFRVQLDKANADMATANQKISEYEAKIKDAEKHGESVKVLSSQLEAKEKEAGELRGQIRMFKQEMSPDFIAKWDKPYTDAAEIARRSIQRLTVIDPKTGEERQASWEKDFGRFFKDALGDGGIIDFKGIKEMFGDGSGIVTNHMEGLLTKYDLREKALGEEKAQWQTKQKEDDAKEITNRTQQEAAAKKFQADEAKFSKEFVEKNPELYDDIPGDDEGNKLRLEAQQELAKSPQTPDEAIAFRTKLYHKAGNFDREHYLRTKAETALAEANATIEAMKASGPGKTRRDGAATTAAGGETWEEEARRTQSAAR